MAYVRADGTVAQKKPFGLSTIIEMFWAIINFFALFLNTLTGTKPEPKRRAQDDFGGGRRGGGGGGG
eukprot:CAMPEP_0113933792 /NCGR_PEP_ID=MMETSP1339-20121228/1110_1 /TAXON_ID=94617 /ORGANISM="Fibrocapsa japonica" /LENGTH=66 /DNA_ID=CAMNT_0000935263 /DNA_START=77 /DNA_END=274 /DNA_ORIENTATION=+ /assembly_acc=CAM_ASM_000762